MLALSLALLFSQAPLPPGHPPLPGSPPAPAAASLPPGHPPMPGSTASASSADGGTSSIPSMDELLERMDRNPNLRKQPKTFEVGVSIARLYALSNRHADAAWYFDQASEQKQTRRLDLGKKKTKSEAESQELQQLLDVEFLRGKSHFLAGQLPQALRVYDEALRVSPNHPEALYARARIRVEHGPNDVKLLKLALQDVNTLSQKWPAFERAEATRSLQAQLQEAIAKGGLSKLARATPPPAPSSPAPASGMPQLTPELIAAMTQNSGSADAQASAQKSVEPAEVFLAKGDYQNALSSYKQVMPVMPNNPRARAGMAWTMVALNRQPMADNIWRVAMQSPEAVLELAQKLRTLGNNKDAAAIEQRAKSTP